MRHPARFTPADLRPKPTHHFDATTDLLDFAIITYAVAPERLAAHLPPGFEPDVYTLDDGREVAFISAVPFRDADFHFHFAPFYKIAMGQTNYRAYVRYQGKRVVWFFGTVLTGPWLWIPRHLWKLPWHTARMFFKTRWHKGVCQEYELTTLSSWAPARMSLTGTTTPMGRLDGFEDEEETAVVLTHPLYGYYWRRNRTLGSYNVWHAPLVLQHAQVEHARFELFERLGLITPDQAPHSALVQKRTTFVIYLPPTPVSAV